MDQLIFVLVLTHLTTTTLLHLLPHVSAASPTRPKNNLFREKLHQYTGRYGNYTWPRRELAVSLDGDVVLGALHMVHERSDERTCGPIMSQGGVQALETMLYTLDYINRSPELLPGIELGLLAKDDCDRDIYGLEQAVDFIRGSIASIGGSDYSCKDGSKPDLEPKVIPGVMGAPSSVTSIQVANLLKLFRIPQVSFFSTSTVLSNRDRYPYFLRTIPSDVNQAQAMVELVRMLNWTYVSVIYEESSYGIQGFNELEKRLKHYGICIAISEKLLKDSGVPSQDYYDDVVKGLMGKTNARGVIIFASDQEVGELMRAVKRFDATGRFSWIGSDGWGARGLAYLGMEAEVEGAVTVQPLAYEVKGFKDSFLSLTPFNNYRSIFSFVSFKIVEGAVTVQPLAYEVKGFKDYFLSLTPFNNYRNPWFVEFWEQHFQCKFPGSSWTPYNEDYNASCTGTERIEPDTFSMEAQLQFVSDSMLAFAHALHNMQKELCGPGKAGPCDNMVPIDGELLKEYLLNVSFTGLSGQKFEFLPNGDGPARYRILNFKQISPGQYDWQTVGYFDNGKLYDISNLQFHLDEATHPESVCSKPCNPGEAQLASDGSRCCWTCVRCHRYQYLPTLYGCVDCPPGWLPHQDKSSCVMIPMRYLRYNDALAIGAIIFSSFGIIATCFVIVTFVIHRDTPVVKASGRELSFVLLFGILMCYTMTFMLVLKPSELSCGAQKYGIGLCFAVCYSAILTKTNRISRIFRAGKRTAKRPKFISPKSQLVICGVIVALQSIIGVMWILLRPPEAIQFFANREDHQLVCKDAVGGFYMIGFSYPIILVIVCTFYAFVTRKIPEGFNESKYIGFTMYTTCIIWLAFVPIYFSTTYDIQLRIATMCYSISLSATVALCCMFTTKLYIILTHPEKNVRKSMMTSSSRTGTTMNAANNASYSATQQFSPVAYQYTVIRSSNQAPSPVEMVSSSVPGSYSSGLSKASINQINGHSISTQTIDSMDAVLESKDVAL